MRTLKISFTIIVLFFVLTIPSLAQTGTVGQKLVNVRKQANTASDVVITIDGGTEVDIVSKEGDWYKISIGELTGYIRQDLLIIKEENHTSESGLKTEDLTDNAPEKTVKVRLIPLVNSSVIGKISKTEEIKVIEVINGWQYIETAKINGWIRKSDITEDITKKEEKVTTEQENIEEQNTNTVADEQQAEVAEIENKIEQPTLTETPKTEVKTSNKKAYISGDDVNLRRKASTDSDILKVLPRNAEIEIIEKLTGWYKIKVNGTEGYVADWLVSDTKVTVTNRSLETPRVAETSSVSINPNATSIVEYAKQFLGCPYVYGGSGPSSFDCSGFTMYVYKQYGYSMSHSATAQSKLGEYVAYEELQPGDLVFFKDYQTMEGIGHCGIYIGDGDFIHASSGTGYCVKISTLLSGSYLNRYATARRLS